jgi:hypothetical protein
MNIYFSLIFPILLIFSFTFTPVRFALFSYVGVAFDLLKKTL